ncbi:MAG: ribosome assembly cofactor RimP [Treponema sp.]|nr:ribosome assembly cofactor RimP [Treponema sp.]
MRWIRKEESAEEAIVKEQIKAVLNGLKYSLLELSVSRTRNSVQVRVVIYNGDCIGTDDCTKVHRAIMPRLELAFDKQGPQPSVRTADLQRESSRPDIYLEVSSPGINRLIKEGAEFTNYKGRGVRCYRTDITEWTAGILESADENEITLKTNNGAETLKLSLIAKAKLDSSVFLSSPQEV